MRITLFALILSSAAVAQQPSLVMTPSTGCPVGFTAQQRSSAETAWVYAREDRSLEQLDQDAQKLDDEVAKSRHQSVARTPIAGSGVHVRLQANNSAMQQVELAVQYVPAGARVLNINTGTADNTKTFHLTASNEPSKTLTGNLLIGATAGITHVSLRRITYADGTTWQGTGCTIEPNRLLLLGSR